MNFWKDNWAETQENFNNWWNHNGVVMGKWSGISSKISYDDSAIMPVGGELMNKKYFTDPQFHADVEHYRVANCRYPDDGLPVARTSIGPGSLALCLGCEPDFGDGSTVWFNSIWEDLDDPQEVGKLEFSKDNYWFNIHMKTLEACKQKAQGRYFVSMPDLISNIDILASLRGPQLLLMDMMFYPEWIEEKVREITQAYFQVYSELFNLIYSDEIGMVGEAFKPWGRGKVSSVQCDASAMFSPEMFERFVVPELIKQCEWLDHSIYHLDGTQAIVHLDSLLKIESIDAIEWTPQAGIESGCHERWYPMYKKILEAGKSVQIVCENPDNLKNIFNYLGTNGIYILKSYLEK